MKTAPTSADPFAFVEAAPANRVEDARRLLTLFGDVTGLTPQMWGGSIIGYGRYEYRYESGRTGEWFLTGFSPRKASLSIYIMPGYRDLGAMLSRLGKHKTGKSCLYINKLADVDETVLRELVADGVAHMRENYTTYDR